MKKKRRVKLSVKLMLGMLAFSFVMILSTSLATSLGVWTKQTDKLSDNVLAAVKAGAEYIDGDTIEKYKTEQEADAYYNSVYRLLSAEAHYFKLHYYYVFVPEEDEIIYIWDGFNPNSVSTLGTRESYPDAKEKERILSIFNGKTEEKIDFSYDEKYGYLGTGYWPVYNSAGEAVAVVGADIDAIDVLYSLRDILVTNIVIVAIITVIGMVFFYRFIHKGIVDPIHSLHSSTSTLIEHLDDENREFKIDVHTNDELEDLADAITEMDADLKDYIVRLRTVTSEKEKISTELNVATKIQEDMLPRIFPPFPDRHDFEIFASMNPAREVGGDFYDFFMVDDTHLGLVIADVSDKGVPAALFMVIAKTLLKTTAQAGGRPAEILASVNNKLCEGNDAGMFVTVWLAILDLESGKGIAANAGHEDPVLKRSGGQFELVKYHHAPPLAVMPDVKFEEHEFELGAGDTVFVYTDGAPEAADKDKNQFGTTRLCDALNSIDTEDPEVMIKTVSKAIDDFVQDAPQFDDTTMLAVTYYGPHQRKKSDQF